MNDLRRAKRLYGDRSGLLGDTSRIWGDATGCTGVTTFVSGDITRIRGDLSGLHGNLTHLRGDVTGLYGYASGVMGAATSFSGDLDSCGITDEQRKAGVWLKHLPSKAIKAAPSEPRTEQSGWKKARRLLCTRSNLTQ